MLIWCVITKSFSTVFWHVRVNTVDTFCVISGHRAERSLRHHKSVSILSGLICLYGVVFDFLNLFGGWVPVVRLKMCPLVVGMRGWKCVHQLKTWKAIQVSCMGTNPHGSFRWLNHSLCPSQTDGTGTVVCHYIMQRWVYRGTGVRREVLLQHWSEEASHSRCLTQRHVKVSALSAASLWIEEFTKGGCVRWGGGGGVLW